MPKKQEVKKRTAFVCAGIVGGAVFHAEAVTEGADEALLDLLQAGERWVEEGAARARFAPQRTGRKPFVPAIALMQSVAESLAQNSPASAPASSDLELLKHFRKEEKEYYNALESQERRSVMERLWSLRTQFSGVPLRFRVLDSQLPEEIKRRIFQKLDRQQDSITSGDMVKYATWVEAMLALPISRLLVPVHMPPEDVSAAMRQARVHLDGIIYGHRAAKQALLERLYLWLKHPLVPQRPLALKGCPGNGKTSLIREGLAVIMNRPFNFMAMGGSFDSSFLLGHSYTYEGSTQGRIADAVVSSTCMNPIFFFDEIDKCSSTPKGEEIVNTLVHLTDTTQNHHFRDRYLNGVELDVSKTLMVFAFNDASKVSPVLLDRFQVVQTDVFGAAEQTQILQNYLLPRILQEHDLPPNFLVLTEDALREAAQVCVEGGVREMRSVLEQIVCKACILNETHDETVLFPLKSGDLHALGASRFELRRGVSAVFQEGRGSTQRPPLGMYI
jgi:ATP-dependent Lon protease